MSIDINTLTQFLNNPTVHDFLTRDTTLKTTLVASGSAVLGAAIPTIVNFFIVKRTLNHDFDKLIYNKKVKSYEKAMRCLNNICKFSSNFKMFMDKNNSDELKELVMPLFIVVDENLYLSKEARTILEDFCNCDEFTSLRDYAFKQDVPMPPEELKKVVEQCHKRFDTTYRSFRAEAKKGLDIQ